MSKVVGRSQPVYLTYEDEDGAMRELHVDHDNSAVVTIDSVHHHIHEGHAWTCEYSASVLNGANMDIRILTGSGEMNFDGFVFAGGACSMFLYEAPNISGGVSLPIHNRKRTHRNDSHGTFIGHTPTVTSVAGSIILINGRYLPGGTSPQTRVGGSSGTRYEWELLSNTEYLFRITNISGGTITVNPVLEFYLPDMLHD